MTTAPDLKLDAMIAKKVEQNVGTSPLKSPEDSNAAPIKSPLITTRHGDMKKVIVGIPEATPLVSGVNNSDIRKLHLPNINLHYR